MILIEVCPTLNKSTIIFHLFELPRIVKIAEHRVMLASKLLNIRLFLIKYRCLVLQGAWSTTD